MSSNLPPLYERVDAQQRHVDTMDLTDDELSLIQTLRKQMYFSAVAGIAFGTIAGYAMCNPYDLALLMTSRSWKSGG